MRASRSTTTSATASARSSVRTCTSSAGSGSLCGRTVGSSAEALYAPRADKSRSRLPGADGLADVGNRAECACEAERSDSEKERDRAPEEENARRLPEA